MAQNNPLWEAPSLQSKNKDSNFGFFQKFRYQFTVQGSQTLPPPHEDFEVL